MSQDRDTKPAQGPDQDRILEHNYDGIQEYDNPLPRWWVYLFWVTIAFSAIYALNVPGVGVGKGRIANYEKEMADAHAKYGAPGAGQQLTDEAVLAVAANPARLASGKQTFVTTCSACHLPDGGGNIGPNLTDEYWLHGGKPSQIWKTVNGGVPEKGMPAWGLTLKPEQVLDVAAYVTTLRGTHPATPKAPQGVRE